MELRIELFSWNPFDLTQVLQIQVQFSFMAHFPAELFFYYVIFTLFFKEKRLSVDLLFDNYNRFLNKKSFNNLFFSLDRFWRVSWYLHILM